MQQKSQKFGTHVMPPPSIELTSHFPPHSLQKLCCTSAFPPLFLLFFDIILLSKPRHAFPSSPSFVCSKKVVPCLSIRLFALFVFLIRDS